MKFFNKLIEQYIVEGYSSQAATDETSRLAAEKAFRAELTNGPQKMVWYGSKQFPKKVGSFDLDNFHKAYDQFFEDNGLLDIFDNNGKLTNKATYVRFKDLDKKLPAIKALGQLWGAQFKGEMEFFADKQAAIAKKQAEEQAKIKMETDLTSLKSELEAEIMKLPQFQKLVINSPEVKAEISFNADKTKHDENNPDYLDTITWIFITINPIIDFGKQDNRFSFDPGQPINKKAILDTVSKKLDTLVANQQLAKSLVDLLSNNLTVYEQRPESKDSISGCYYLDVSSSVVYRLSAMPYKIGGTNKSGKILIDVKANKKSTKLFTKDFILIGLLTDTYSYANSRGTYHNNRHKIYFNSSFKKQLEEAGIDFEIRHDVGMGTTADISDNVPAPYNKYFDKVYNYEYELDSGD